MKPLFLGTVLCALALAQPGSAIAKGSAAPSSWAGYIGKYPWEKVKGVTFLKDPRVRAAVARAVPSAEIREDVLGEDMIFPIIKVGERLLVFGYDHRSAGSTNWAILASLDGSKLAVCYYTEFENERVDWYVDGQKVDGSAYERHKVARGCPGEAGDLASLGTFPIGPMPS